MFQKREQEFCLRDCTVTLAKIYKYDNIMLKGHCFGEKETGQHTAKGPWGELTRLLRFKARPWNLGHCSSRWAARGPQRFALVPNNSVGALVWMQKARITKFFKTTVARFPSKSSTSFIQKDIDQRKCNKMAKLREPVKLQEVQIKFKKNCKKHDKSMEFVCFMV